MRRILVGNLASRKGVIIVPIFVPACAIVENVSPVISKEPLFHAIVERQKELRNAARIDQYFSAGKNVRKI